jgi:hypothetical protein
LWVSILVSYQDNYNPGIVKNLILCLLTNNEKPKTKNNLLIYPLITPNGFSFATIRAMPAPWPLASPANSPISLPLDKPGSGAG